MTKKVKIYDTTLRDGAQMEGISFSLEDKIKIAKKLDELGIHYIEGGWPGSNPKDIEFFEKIKNIPMKQAKVVAFGTTRRAHIPPEQDINLRSLIESGTEAVTVCGKSWRLHVSQVLRTSLEENLQMIEDSVAFLKSKGLEVIYDAEHFFDGYKDNPDYAMKTIKVAQKAGADTLVLCDTNGGSLPDEVSQIIKKVRRQVQAPLGIHAHNDADLAVANTLAAVREGVTHIQGTINGYGERCGNANLCSVIPNLKLKMRIDCLSGEALKELTELSRYVTELANLHPQDNQPYVGRSAFAHKGGLHVDAIVKHSRTYEHIPPELVGNQRRVLVSELSGRSTIMQKAKEYNIDLTKDSPEMRKIFQRLKHLEHDGYLFEGAEASFELLMKKSLGTYRKLFDLLGFRVITEKRGEGDMVTEATIKVRVDDQELLTAAEGDGPVHALDNALRKALEHFYPSLKGMKLTDFKVRVLDTRAGTAAKVRVLIESSDDKTSWGTVGVSENIIEASWQALVDSIEYGLLKRD